MEALQPKDFIEETLARDVADHTWDVRRLRSIEARMLTLESAPLPQASLQSKGPPNVDQLIEYFTTPAEVLARRPRDNEERARMVQEFAGQYPEKYERYLQRQREGPKSVAEIIGSSPSEPEPVHPTVPADAAHRLATDAFKNNSREIDQISRLIALHESRRNAALRELERYQAVRRARAPHHEILDAEYTEAPPPMGRSKP
jgi:hypothetical protein